MEVTAAQLAAETAARLKASLASIELSATPFPTPSATPFPTPSPMPSSVPPWLQYALQDRPANPGIPRIIWAYWDAGIAAAPTLVQHCLASWIITNPTWKVVVLTDSVVLAYLHGWTEETWRQVRMQVFAGAPATYHTAARGDILRITLMRDFGGVWVDATMFCALPLDHWIPQALGDGGFFSFAAPTMKQPKTPETLNVCRGCEPPGEPIAAAGRCRALNDRRSRTERPSNSFMASVPQSYVARAMYDSFVGHMLRTRLVTPRHGYHDMFEQLARTNATFRAAWFAIPEITSMRVVTALPISGAHANPVARLTPALKSRIDRVCAPMFKMTYKGVENRSAFADDTVQGYLFQRTASYLPTALRSCGPEQRWPCHYTRLAAARPRMIVEP